MKWKPPFNIIREGLSWETESPLQPEASVENRGRSPQISTHHYFTPILHLTQHKKFTEIDIRQRLKVIKLRASEA